jgi:hypothetical protein
MRSLRRWMIRLTGNPRSFSSLLGVNKLHKFTALFLAAVFFCTGCTRYHSPYKGVNPQNPQIERGMTVPPLDFFGDLISKPLQLLFWTRRYGNHSISAKTEDAIEQHLKFRNLTDVKVRINQWAPHKEIARLFRNKHIAWPYRILFLPSTLIASLLGRPLSGLIISDYYDPGSNSIHLFSDEISIAIHEAGHAHDFAGRKWKGTYALCRIIPGFNVFQEAIASDEAFYYLETTENYEELLRAYKILYPAFSTYIANFIPLSFFGLLGALTVGHFIGRAKSKDKERELAGQGSMAWRV